MGLKIFQFPRQTRSGIRSFSPVMVSKAPLEVIGTSNIIFVNSCAVEDVDKIHLLAKKRGAGKTNPSIIRGSRGIRTPDPLLVRQML